MGESIGEKFKIFRNTNPYRIMSDEDVSPDYLIKIILVGDSGVGKSNLLLRWTKNEFNPQSTATIGVEFATQTVRIYKKKNTEKDDHKEKDDNDYYIVKVQIWDTAGQERYRAVTSAYYRGAYGALLVYDITSSQSFDDASDWLHEIRENTGEGGAAEDNIAESSDSKLEENIDVILIGNKSDLDSLRAVSVEEATEFAKHEGLHFLETSSKTSQNVNKAFYMLVEQIVSKLAVGSIDKSRSSKNSNVSLVGKRINSVQLTDSNDNIENENNENENNNDQKKKGCC